MVGRLANLLRGFLGRVASGIERRNPEALLDVEKDNLRRQIANYNEGLAAHAGLCERLMTQIRRLEQEERELRARAAANLRAANRDIAASYALRLQTTRRELAENRTQLTHAETTHNELIKARDVSVHAAQLKLEQLKSGLDDARIQRATAELAALASGTITSIGGAGDTLDRMHRMIAEARDLAAGRTREPLQGEMSVREEEERAVAEQALAEFVANEGISIESLEPVAES